MSRDAVKDPETADTALFCYSPRQRTAILKALAPDVEVDREGLVAKLTEAARIALDPSRFTWSDRPRAPKPVRRLQDAVEALDADSRHLLIHVGIDVHDLSTRLELASRFTAWTEIMNAKKRGQRPPSTVLVLTKLQERRKLFVLNVLNVWSTTMPAPERWPLGRVKDGSPLLRLAEAALPEQLQRRSAHGQPFKLRKVVNTALLDLGWPDHKTIR
jgi:hypothetical protein